MRGAYQLAAKLFACLAVTLLLLASLATSTQPAGADDGGGGLLATCPNGSGCSNGCFGSKVCFTAGCANVTGCACDKNTYHPNCSANCKCAQVSTICDCVNK